jgi:ribonuclease P protein component
LPRSASLKGRAEIDSLFANGRRIPTPFFTLLWEPADAFKYGIFLSRQTGTAARRNRLKRRFREALRFSRERLTRTGRVGIIPRPVETEPELELLIDDVSRLFEQLSREE